jgi:hypothetical protein
VANDRPSFEVQVIDAGSQDLGPSGTCKGREAERHLNPRSTRSCMNVRQKLLHLSDGQEKTSPEAFDFLCREPATCELALDLLLRLERRLGPPLCVNQSLGGSDSANRRE